MIELILAKLAEKTTRYIAVALAAVLLLVGTYVKGRTDGRTIAMAEYSVQLIEWQTRIDQATFQVTTEMAILNDYYKKEIGRLVGIIGRLKDRPIPIPPDADRFVPRGFVYVHNSAASGNDFNDTLEDAGAPTDKKLSDVARVVATNYYSCNAVRAQLVTLQNTIKAYQEKQKELTR